MTRKIFILIPVLVFIGGAVFGGLNSCTTIKGMIGLADEKPIPHLKGVAVNSISFTSVKLSLLIEVENPNNHAVRMDGFQYEVLASSLLLAKGNFDEKLEVPAQARLDVVVPCELRTEVLGKVIKKFLNSPENIAIRVKGTFGFWTPFGTIEIPFDKEKTLQSQM